LARRLLRELLGDPHRAADRRERQQEQAGEEPHQPASASETKLCGGSGPRYLKVISPSCARASSSMARSKASTRPRSTRNDAVSARVESVSSTTTSTASGCSRARIESAS